jgi:hypothetical protein
MGTCHALIYPCFVDNDQVIGFDILRCFSHLKTAIKPNDRGHYSIPLMGIELGIQYDQKDTPTPWLRFWDGDGNLLLTGDERAVIEMQARLQAEVERSLEQKARQEAEAAQKQAEAAGRILQGIAEQANLEKQKAEQKAQRLAEMLRSLGINPDEM